MSTPTILDNIRSILKTDCGINPDTLVVIPFQPQPDRIRVEWHQDLFALALRDWHKDANNGKNHGGDVLMSLRQRTSPSMQICVHYELVVRDGLLPLIKLYMEIDIDKYFLGTFVGIFKHGSEVLENKLSRKLTDQEWIAGANAERWGIAA